MSVTQHLRLLIVNPNQFGYHTDTYMYAKYLDSAIHTTYICIDYGRPKRHIEGVNVIYAEPKFLPGKLGRFVGFLLMCISQRKEFDVYFIKQFSGSFLLQFFLPRKRTILDIRTLSVHEKWNKRLPQNALIRLDLLFSDIVTVVSRELGTKLGRPDAVELGLGCELPVRRQITQTSIGKAFFNIVYVGTLTGRKLETFIQGYIQWRNRSGRDVFTFDIVGDGYFGERQLLENLVDKSSIADRVKFLGYLMGEDLERALQDADFGLVHVPNEERYRVQPSTKLFEYWAWGLPILGTSYLMNEKYCESGLGILYDDSPAGVASALESIVQGITFRTSDEIATYAKQYSWSSIVEKQLEPLLLKLAKL